MNSQSKCSRLSGILSRTLLLLAGVTVVVGPGCTRRHYRVLADREAGAIIAEKSNDLRWSLPGYTIEQDPRSRYYEPYDQDCPPMPPDDPVSHQYMHYLDAKKGWAYWHRDGDRPEYQNPSWTQQLGQYVELTRDGSVILSLDSALRLAYLHSPDYQTQLETLYLSALDVTTERFRFDSQFFGSNSSFGSHVGRLRGGRERNAFQSDSTGRVTREFATAGDLVVNFANTIVWNFTGNEPDFSLLGFTLTQPLLRAAGRNIALEQLTIVERSMLGNLRAFQRYRQGFYTRVAIGESGVGTPQRRGGFLGGTGLTGFSGTGAGGLGGVGEATGFGRGAFGGGAAGGGGGGAGFAGGGAGTVGGFIGLLQQLQQIRNTEATLELFLRTLAVLEANLEAGVIDLTQVDQFRQSVETERANLLQAQISLASSLDSFKTGTLGLPPNLPVELDDELIRQFQFLDPRVGVLQNRVADLQVAVGNLPADPPLEGLRSILEQAQVVAVETDRQFASTANDLDNMQQQAQRRRLGMPPADQQRFDREMATLGETLAGLRQRYERYVEALGGMLQSLTEANRQETDRQLVAWLQDFYRLIQETSLIQARARVESIVIEPVELSPERALEVALAIRLDLMDARAGLVDSWRLISFNANRLQSDVSVFLEGNLRTARDNPVSFERPNGSLRGGIQIDPPLTRLLERNNYRQALIDYQRDRRQFIQAIDAVHLSLRDDLRRLNQLRTNLEIQRRAVVISIRRVDLTREDLNRPVPPAQPGQPAETLGPTAALNSLTALSDLRTTQDNFMSVWLNYYAARMRLSRDLGVLRLDELGRWIDEPINERLLDGLQSQPLPPSPPSEWLRVLDTFEEVQPQPSPPPDRPDVLPVSHQEPLPGGPPLPPPPPAHRPADPAHPAAAAPAPAESSFWSFWQRPLVNARNRTAALGRRAFSPSAPANP